MGLSNVIFEGGRCGWFVRRVPGSRAVTTAATSDLKRKYTAGTSIRELAAETGRSYGFVHRMLIESGVTLRGRGGATRGKKS